MASLHILPSHPPPPFQPPFFHCYFHLGYVSSSSSPASSPSSSSSPEPSLHLPSNDCINTCPPSKTRNGRLLLVPCTSMTRSTTSRIHSQNPFHRTPPFLRNHAQTCQKSTTTASATSTTSKATSTATISTAATTTIRGPCP